MRITLGITGGFGGVKFLYGVPFVNIHETFGSFNAAGVEINAAGVIVGTLRQVKLKLNNLIANIFFLPICFISKFNNLSS